MLERDSEFQTVAARVRGIGREDVQTIHSRTAAAGRPVLASQREREADDKGEHEDVRDY